MPAEVQEVEKLLNSSDRCDKCYSQAYFGVLLESGELYFCRHHFMENEDLLKESAKHIIDQSAELHRRQETGAYPDLSDT